MAQHQLHNKAITWFKTSSHGMNAALVACAMLGSSTAWAVDPSVKQLRVGYQKASVNLVIAQRQNKNCLKKNFQMQKSAGMNSQADHKF